MLNFWEFWEIEKNKPLAKLEPYKPRENLFDIIERLIKENV
jgi:hypothetical protein